MTHDVYVFGDSHWRNFFPFVNHGAATDNVSHEKDGIRTIDTIANELSGSTMWGLLNANSKHGARNRILSTIDSLGGVQNVGLTFGEVDVRYHHAKYFSGNKISLGRVHELLGRFERFIDEDLIQTGRVAGKVFVYYGYDYPKMGDTLLQPGQPIGLEGYMMAREMHEVMESEIELVRRWDVHLIRASRSSFNMMGYPLTSEDGVHLIPERIYPMIFDRMFQVLCPEKMEIPF